MSDFAFQIGDVVMHKLAVGHHRLRGIVIGRYYDECIGGIQRHYGVRWVVNSDTQYSASVSGATEENARKYHDFEIVPFEMHPADVAEEQKRSAR